MNLNILASIYPYIKQPLYMDTLYKYKDIHIRILFKDKHFLSKLWESR